MKIDGRCHCGYISYEAEIDPEKIVICHCTDSDVDKACRALEPNLRHLSKHGSNIGFIEAANAYWRRVEDFPKRAG